MKWTPPRDAGVVLAKLNSERPVNPPTALLGVPPLKTYWRSLAEIEDTPEFREALEREFPEGASELPEGVTRRDMMMLLGASLSLAGARRMPASGRGDRSLRHRSRGGRPRESARHYATTMPFGRSAYGLIVESHEGRPTKVEGNPAHPSTLGASSSRIQASVLGLYDPDRSQSVTLKGDKKSWSDFVAAWGQLSAPMPPTAGRALPCCRSPSRRRPWRGWPRSSARVTPGCSGRPTTPSATRTGSRVCGRPPGATSISCSGSIERR